MKTNDLSQDHHEHASAFFYVKIYILLIVLLVASLFFTRLPFSHLSIMVLSLGVSAIKTYFIMTYFMHLKEQSRLLKIFSVSGILWLFILIHYTMSDYVTR